MSSLSRGNAYIFFILPVSGTGRVRSRPCASRKLWWPQCGHVMGSGSGEVIPPPTSITSNRSPHDLHVTISTTCHPLNRAGPT